MKFWIGENSLVMNGGSISENSHKMSEPFIGGFHMTSSKT